ncbi:fructosamine kinase family protein [Spirosoma validum]|uniref:Fructosamine kinase family protein n=1 Tax=Spirosoma validum TaxID=2771355 RepID=A0A927GEI8_9BACT|nr:fructosamine kinase family protein [Spirosoma validum]MBD2754660.1 fructosamine kinase family protein [Spirosoma validum]
MDFWGDEQFSFFESILFSTLGKPVQVIETQFISGGDINVAAQVFSSEGVFFVKWNTFEQDENQNLFEAEAKGLDLLRQTDALQIPQVIGYGRHGDKAYLILEYIELGKPNKTYWHTLGQSLALLHSHTQPKFGLHFDNFIGSLKQTNTLTASGYDFFFDHRLLPQAGLAMYRGLLSKDAYDALLRLRTRLPELIPNERPALLHGDLWSGNVLINEHNKPVLIDPAVYYGFREAELAFTKLFAGFDEYFYEAYDEAFPLESGFNERVGIYNLYPLLVHVNLFGSGYVSGVERILKQF